MKAYAVQQSMLGFTFSLSGKIPSFSIESEYLEIACSNSFAEEVAMKITVKYFAVLAEAAGKSEEQLDLEQVLAGESVSIESLYHSLQQRYQFPLEFHEIRCALNTCYVQADSPLSEGDTLVFISPVAGG